MTDKRMKVPGLDQPITIERNPGRVVVVVAGRIIADTCNAVTLREESYAAVQYVPRKDVEAPFPAVAEIRGHLAFYPDRVDAIGERREACEERLEFSPG
jgi:uncharacterized protein (DUF427 family)